MSHAFWTTTKQLRRSPYQALIASMVLTLTFFAVGVFSIIFAGSHFLLKHFEAAPQVIAFFEKGKDISDSRQEEIKAKFEASGKLATFKYISAKEAEAIYKEKNKDDPLLLELVDYKILPPSIEISATSIEALPELKSILESEPEVVDIAFYEDIVKSLTNWVKNIRLIGISLIGFLIFLSILIIFVIISMKVAAKKREIGILRLLGASNWFIQGPFVLEGIFYGVVGAFFGWLFAYTLLLYATPLLISWLEDLQLLPVDPILMLMLLGVMVLSGMIIGSLSSLLATKRFFRR